MTEEPNTATTEQEVVNFEVDQDTFAVKPPDGNMAYISVWDNVLSAEKCEEIIVEFEKA